MDKKNKMTVVGRKGEAGNALFLILIAVALFAALSYAVTQSGRGGGTIDRETAMIAAGQITQYPSTLRTAITRMIITGTAVSLIDFQPAGSTTTCGPSNADTCVPAQMVFEPAGGGAVEQRPPANIGNAQGGATGTTVSSWGYKDVLDASKGYYIEAVGTDTSVSGREVVAYIHDITIGVCEQILKGLGLSSTPSTTATVDYASGGGKGADTFDSGTTFKLTPSLGSQAFACVKNGAVYDYYHALVEQ